MLDRLREIIAHRASSTTWRPPGAGWWTARRVPEAGLLVSLVPHHYVRRRPLLVLMRYVEQQAVAK